MRKQKHNGFTIVELLVVLSIMLVFSAILIVSFNRQSGPRNLKISQSQLATNIRKTQSYILSARNISSGSSQVPAKYYGLSLERNANQYTVLGIDAAYTLNTPLETIKLPSNIIISNIQYISSSGTTYTPSSVQIAFSAPFGRTYAYTSLDNCAVSLLAAIQNPACLLTLSDRQVVITLQHVPSGITKTITVNGVSGTVVSSQ
jgi:prepilin-type N-terminal cleavage/methylation domain-containing protein